MEEKRSINLLEEREVPLTFWERIYSWVTNTCRVIVIFVEAIVLVAFGIRFYFDRKLTDLKEEIKDEASILQNYKQQEEEIRQLQNNITEYSSIWTNSSNYKLILNEINSLVPKEASDLSISLQNSKVSISGTTTRDLIEQLENNVKESSSFVNVTLTNISTGDNEGSDNSIVEYDFTLTAEIVNFKTRTPII